MMLLLFIRLLRVSSKNYASVNVVVKSPAFHSSVVALGGKPPPKTRADVFDAPHPDNLLVAAVISDNSVQLVPFQDSVKVTAAVPLYPPKAKADV